MLVHIFAVYNSGRNRVLVNTRFYLLLQWLIFQIMTDVISKIAALRDLGKNLSVAQRSNLRCFEEGIREQWAFGKNIALCWMANEKGIWLLFVPHHFLGQFSASMNECAEQDRLEALNGQFLRGLIGGARVMSASEFNGTAKRFRLEPKLISLPAPFLEDGVQFDEFEAIVKRYSISYVEKRGVILFDIVDFSLYTPFEQMSQLNSLSYSINSVHNKMRKQGINVQFERTTTGDGFYIWNRDVGPIADSHLFQMMLLIVADNALARRKNQGNTVPYIRSGFHIGGHYQFFQPDGVDPGLSSYIVGDVTIELARMLNQAQAEQIFVGEFNTQIPTSDRDGAYLVDVNTEQFVERINKTIDAYNKIDYADEKSRSIYCYVSGETGAGGGEMAKRFVITDKHGLTRNVYNLRMNIYCQGQAPIILGMQGRPIPRGKVRRVKANEGIDFLKPYMVREREPQE